LQVTPAVTRRPVDAADARALGVEDWEAGMELRSDIPAPLQGEYDAAFYEAEDAFLARESRAWRRAIEHREKLEFMAAQRGQAATGEGNV
jgi:hypothetical protein